MYVCVVYCGVMAARVVLCVVRVLYCIVLYARVDVAGCCWSCTVSYCTVLTRRMVSHSGCMVMYCVVVYCWRLGGVSYL